MERLHIALPSTVLSSFDRHGVLDGNVGVYLQRQQSAVGLAAQRKEERDEGKFTRKRELTEK